MWEGCRERGRILGLAQECHGFQVASTQTPGPGKVTNLVELQYWVHTASQPYLFRCPVPKQNICLTLSTFLNSSLVCWLLLPNILTTRRPSL